MKIICSSSYKTYAIKTIIHSEIGLAAMKTFPLTSTVAVNYLYVETAIDSLPWFKSRLLSSASATMASMGF